RALEAGPELCRAIRAPAPRASSREPGPRLRRRASHRLADRLLPGPAPGLARKREREDAPADRRGYDQEARPDRGRLPNWAEPAPRSAPAASERRPQLSGRRRSLPPGQDCGHRDAPDWL